MLDRTMAAPSFTWCTIIMLVLGAAAPASLIVSARTIYVPDDYPKIQLAVDSANAGDTIVIRNGIYIENVLVNLDYLTIRSENGYEHTTIKAKTPDYDTFHVVADHVTIFDLTVTGASEAVPPWPAGIYLFGAKYANISKNHVTLNHDGIETEGTSFDSTSFAVIRDNIVDHNRENDLEIDPYTDSSLIENNNVEHARSEFFLYVAPNNTLRNNRIQDNSGLFGILGNTVADYLQDIDTSNTVNGKPIYYWIQKHDRVVPKDAGFVGIISSKNMRVEDFTLANNSQGLLLVNSSNIFVHSVNTSSNFNGIWMFLSSDITIDNLTSENDSLTGISILNSTRINIYNSSFTENKLTPIKEWPMNWGIFLDNASYNNIKYNKIINNSYGIYMVNKSQGNNIFFNDFISNTVTVNATDIGQNRWNSSVRVTYWYQGKIFRRYFGNFWGDYKGSDANHDGIGDTPYIINSNNIDYSPLIQPWEKYPIFPI